MSTSNRKTRSKYEGPKEKAQKVLEIADIKHFLGSFDIVISEIEGVVWRGLFPIPGVAEAVAKFRNAGKPCKFVTGDSTHSDENLITIFKNFGISEVKSSDIVYPIKTISRFLTQHKEGKSIFSLCPKHINRDLAATGATIISLDQETQVTLENIREIVKPQNNVCSVVIDLNFNINYPQLARAYQYLLDSRCTLLVGSTNACQRIDREATTFGNAGFVDMLKQHAKNELIILGKPSKFAGDDIISEFHIRDPKRALFIGNSIMDDIKFAIDCGFQSLLVLNDITQMESVNILPDSLKPDYIANTMTDVVELFQRNNM